MSYFNQFEKYWLHEQPRGFDNPSTYDRLSKLFMKADLEIINLENKIKSIHQENTGMKFCRPGIGKIEE